MSEENVEIARRIVELTNGRDVEGITGLMSPDIVCFPGANQPEPKVFRGREAFAKYAKGWFEAFQEYAIEASEYLDRAEYVVVIGRVVGRGRESGAGVSGEDAWVYRFQDGKVVEYHECGTKAEALEAAGLRE